MKKQIRVTVTISEEQEREIAKAYARYLLEEDGSLTKNQWIRHLIMKEIQ